MKKKRSSRKPVESGSDKVQLGAETTERRKRLRIPQLREGEGICDLRPEEEAFIQEEIALREERCWSQAEVARRGPLGRSTVQHFEHRRRSPSYRVMLAISRAFGIPVEEFIRRSRRWIGGGPQVLWFLGMCGPW